MVTQIKFSNVLFFFFFFKGVQIRRRKPNTKNVGQTIR